MLTPHPALLPSVGQPFSVKLASVPALQTPYPENQQKPLPTQHLPNREFCRALVLVKVASGLLVKCSMRVYAAHTRSTKAWTPYDLFFIKPLL